MGAGESKRRIRTASIVLVVSIGIVVLSVFAVQSVLFPGSPRPDAELADAQIRPVLVENGQVVEEFHESVRSPVGEWSLQFGDVPTIVEWQDGQPETVDFEANGSLSLGISSSGELLVADLAAGDVEVSTLSKPVAEVQGGETPILELTDFDENVLFGFTNDGFGAFPIVDEQIGASHLFDAREVLEVHSVDDEYFMFAIGEENTNTLTRWTSDSGFETLLELPDGNFRDPSVGVNEDGTVYVGIDDSVWRSEAPYVELELVTQARVDRGDRWLGWVEIAPDASAWIYHEVDSGYLLTGGPDEEWRQAAYRGLPIGEEWRLGDGNSVVELAYADSEQIVVDSYEGRIWIERFG